MSENLFIDHTDTKKIESIGGFLSLIDKDIDFAPIYRGQSNIEWGLIPSIGRPNFKFSKDFVRTQPFTQEIERNFLHRFKRHSYKLLDRTLDPWETLFLARHHGLPVRIIDWTTSPLVALYFACVSTDNMDKDGAIWVFRNTTETTNEYEDVFEKNKDPLALTGVRIVFPFYSSPRMIAQSSLFTIHAHPWPDLSTVSNGNHQVNQIADGQKWKIPKKSKFSIIKELHALQINERTLFPDLDGIARDILNTELIFRSNNN